LRSFSDFQVWLKHFTRSNGVNQSWSSKC